jgi:hypothetical protein
MAPIHQPGVLRAQQCAGGLHPGGIIAAKDDFRVASPPFAVCGSINHRVQYSLFCPARHRPGDGNPPCIQRRGYIGPEDRSGKENGIRL